MSNNKQINSELDEHLMVSYYKQLFKELDGGEIVARKAKKKGLFMRRVDVFVVSREGTLMMMCGGQIKRLMIHLETLFCHLYFIMHHIMPDKTFIDL